MTFKPSPNSNDQLANCEHEFYWRDRTTNFIVIIADTKKYLLRKQEVIDGDIKKGLMVNGFEYFSHDVS